MIATTCGPTCAINHATSSPDLIILADRKECFKEIHSGPNAIPGIPNDDLTRAALSTRRASKRYLTAG